MSQIKELKILDDIVSIIELQVRLLKSKITLGPNDPGYLEKYAKIIMAINLHAEENQLRDSDDDELNSLLGESAE